MKEFIKVEKSNPLIGEIGIPGAKNSSLGLIAAACLANTTVRLEKIPHISDIKVACEILTEIGATITNERGNLHIYPSKIRHSELNIDLCSKYRASYYFIGALLSKFKKVIIGYPGGDDFGQRPIDQHIKGFEALGAKITFFKDHYMVEADVLLGAEIYFDVITSGATINLMLASVLAKGETKLLNAARDPEVVDVANMLIQMGAKIKGAGTDQITIKGVDELTGCTFQVIPDRLIAGSLLIAAGITGGEIKIKNIIPQHLNALVSKLQEMGMEFQIDFDSITAFGDKKLKATRVKTGMYPMFATDLQQPLTALMLKANGRSIVTDPIYPNRFEHVHQLTQLGANITKKGNSIFINGNHPLVGTVVRADDVRAGTCLLLAGLMAEGTTRITDIHHIYRGYEDLPGLFNQLGAKVTVERVPSVDSTLMGKNLVG